MRTTSNTWLRHLAVSRLWSILVPLFLLGSLPAQDGPPKVGFIRLINAVGPGTGNAHLKVDGEDMFPKGYKLGQRTGGIGLLAGSKKITVSREGVEEGTTTLSLGVGETVSLISFAEKVPAKDDKPEHWEIKLLRLKQRDVEGGYRLTVISVTGQAETLFSTRQEGNKEKVANSVKRLMTTSIDLGKQAGDVGVFLRDAEESLCFFRPDTPGNYVVVLYDDTDGKVQAVSFYDPKFVIAG